MHLLIWSIVCSVSVSVLLKLVPRYALDIRQAILMNYVVAASATWLFLRPDLGEIPHLSGRTWMVLVSLGVLLPSMFWVMAGAVRVAGVVRTDAAMRLSLLLPLAASFTFLGEALTIHKAVGLGIGLVAIGLLITRESHTTSGHALRGMMLLATIFAGLGVIDILFKLIAAMEVASSSAVLFTVFCVAAGIALLAVGGLYWGGAAQWHVRHVIAGALLGALNFGNIYTYILAHRVLSENPSLVFATMNIGVIVVATLVGVAVFKERLGRVHSAGIVCAMVAVVVLATAV